MLKKWTSLLLSGAMLMTLVGCSGGPQPSSNAGSGSYTAASPNAVPQQQKMSAKKKLVLLAGAAALAYLYNKHKNQKGVGANGQYYRSKNGRIYYRDANGKAVWVTPPSQGVYVPQDEADTYRQQAQDFQYASPSGAN
jgi:hypothetical protein